MRAPKTAAEALGTGDAHPDAVHVDGRRLTFEDLDVRVFENATDPRLAVGVVVVVTEHCHHGNRQTSELVGQDLDLFRATASRQVAGQQQEVGAVLKMLQAGAEDFSRALAVVKVADGGDPNHDTGSSPSGSAAGTTVVSLTTS